MPRQLLLDTVKLAVNAGLCVNPPRQDGSKAPLGESDHNHKWERFKTERPLREQLVDWYKDRQRTGLGLFCGAISGNLEVLDFDDRTAYGQFKTLAIEAGLNELVERIETGYLEYSPNGVHWLYFCDEISGNTKLASRPKSESDNSKTLIETRGEGGYIIIAPSYGTINPSGSYVVQSGSLATIPTITPEERRTLHDLAILLNVQTTAPMVERNNNIVEKKSSNFTEGTRPGDEFNARTTWDEILIPHGWQKCQSHGETVSWTRPGKSEGVSATTNHAGTSLLYVFTSSTCFEPNRTYSKFSAYALLNHGGDHSATARELAQNGYGMPTPRHTPATTNGTQRKLDAPIMCETAKNPQETDTAETEETPDLFTDTRISHFFAMQYRDVLRYQPAFKKWLVYDGLRWSADIPGGPYPFLKSMVRKMIDKSQDIADAKKRVECVQHILKLESHLKQTTLLSASQYVPEFVIDSSLLDSNPMFLNVKNGTIDLHNGILQPHSATDYITKLVDVDFHANSQCPTFVQFLNQIFDNNQNLIGYLQRFFGYCLTGLTVEQVMVFFYGLGANGKTTLANVLECLLGDTAITANSDLLMQRENRGASNDLAVLRGTRLVKVSEIDDGEKLSEAQIKTLTGGDRVTCRFLYGEFFQYTPTYKILLLGNYKPKVRGRDYGIWRRIHLLPFNVTVPECERDPNLFEKLKSELPGILSWAVEGCLEWQKNGLRPPPEVIAEVEQYNLRSRTL